MDIKLVPFFLVMSVSVFYCYRLWKDGEMDRAWRKAIDAMKEEILSRPRPSKENGDHDG